MEQRKYGKQPWSVGIFGMGCLRVPQTKDEAGNTVIDREPATALVRRAIDRGVNYLDTAALYQDGDNEAWLGEALRDGYREKVKLVTKLPLWLLSEEADIERTFEEECRRLNTDFIDVYLLHSMCREYWDIAKKFHALDHLVALREQGRIGAIGFSFHDGPDIFREMVDAFDWDMCQLQLNILDVHKQATIEGLRYAAKKGLAVVIMEPLQGGRLATVPDYVQKIYDQWPERRSPVEWAMRYLYSMPEVTCILSGVSTVEQLDDNLRIFESARANVMTKGELAIVDQVRAAFESHMAVGCTACGYCQPCPKTVDIPAVFARWNGAAVFGEWEKMRDRFARLEKAGHGPSACIACGKCQSHCPQHLPIIQKLQEAKAALGEG